MMQKKKPEMMRVGRFIERACFIRRFLFAFEKGAKDLFTIPYIHKNKEAQIKRQPLKLSLIEIDRAASFLHVSKAMSWAAPKEFLRGSVKNGGICSGMNSKLPTSKS